MLWILIIPKIAGFKLLSLSRITKKKKKKWKEKKIEDKEKERKEKEKLH